MADKRRGLGRGLGALIPATPTTTEKMSSPVDVFFQNDDRPEVTRPPARKKAGVERHPDHLAVGADDLVVVPGATYKELAPNTIRPNPQQPRKEFDEDDMAELVHSVKEIGVLQPIVVRPAPADAPAGVEWELIMGERRWRASQKAGLDTVPAIVRNTQDDELLRDALLENLHRSELNPLEEAAAYAQLLQDFDCTHDELSDRIGRSRPQISNTVRLLKLPALVQRRVAAGVLSAGHARALLSLSDGGQMEELAQRIVAEGLSVRSTEEIVSLMNASESKGAKNSARKPHKLTELQQEKIHSAADSLSNVLDTRVGVTMGRNKGKITIEFANMADLDRIMAVLDEE